MQDDDTFKESGGTPFVVGGDGQSPKSFLTKRYLIIAGIVAAVIVLVATGAFLLMHKSTPDGAVKISENVVSVNVKADGYLPATIKVKKGQEVTWTNGDTAPHRMTADQSGLPGFNTGDLLEQGDSYTYILEKSGTFHYYDPADPQKYIGTIQVE